MSFKCSVFGHRYGDPEVEREREEQGSEVVITIKETETCKRCGETRVVSENKEVTTLETPSDIVGDDIEDDTEDGETVTDEEPATDTSTDSTGTPVEATEPGSDDAELIDEAESADEGAPTGTATGPAEEPAGTQSVSEAAVAEDPDAEEDDAVILDEGEEESDEKREPGEWPDDAEADDEDDEDDEWTPSTDTELRPVEEEQPDVEPTSSAVTVPEGTFHCPECEFTTDVESSSLRAGDFCPECHRGSLQHHADEE